MSLTKTRSRDILGTSALRPDGIPKVKGSFEFSSDANDDSMAWGATLRSPHPSARIRSIDISGALLIPGVHAVITAKDVPGKPTYGLISQDQPVFARDVVRYMGEPIAAVAADHPETARRALDAIVVDYEVMKPLTDPEEGISGSHPPIHPDGNVFRHQRIIRGDQTIVGEVVVEDTYEIGMQDQAFLGLEAALARPLSGRGVESRLQTVWGSPRMKSFSLSEASAVHSVHEKTSAFKCTVVSWLLPLDDPSRCNTDAKSPSSDTCIATQPRSGCAITQRSRERSSALKLGWSSMAARTRARHLPS
jgi:xanthine dehydrogenase molybdopterin-binding subunit B